MWAGMLENTVCPHNDNLEKAWWRGVTPINYWNKPCELSRLLMRASSKTSPWSNLYPKTSHQFFQDDLPKNDRITFSQANYWKFPASNSTGKISFPIFALSQDRTSIRCTVFPSCLCIVFARDNYRLDRTFQHRSLPQKTIAKVFLSCFFTVVRERHVDRLQQVSLVEFCANGKVGVYAMVLGLSISGSSSSNYSKITITLVG